MSRVKQVAIDVEVNSVIENSRQSFSESHNDILRRLLLPKAPFNGEEKAKPRDIPPPSEPVRVTGRWTVVRGDSRVAAANLKDAYRSALLLLNDEFPDFLDVFSRQQARTRRFVARVPEELYLSSPRLARDHAKPLVDGWYFDSNLSTDQVARRVRIAARICNLRYGADLQILNNFQQI